MLVVMLVVMVVKALALVEVVPLLIVRYVEGFLV